MRVSGKICAGGCDMSVICQDGVRRRSKGVRVECVAGSKFHDGLGHLRLEVFARSAGGRGHIGKGQLRGQIGETDLVHVSETPLVVIKRDLSDLLEGDSAGASLGSGENRVPRAGTECNPFMTVSGLIVVVTGTVQQGKDGAQECAGILSSVEDGAAGASLDGMSGSLEK